MTKISPEMQEAMRTEIILPVSADVSFASNEFPKYKLGPDNQILEEPKEENKGPSLKEVVEQETMQLADQHKRLSVRDLASKFDKNLAAAAKMTEEAKLREVASLEGHVLLKKLRDALESLRGRMAGRNKEDVEQAISMRKANCLLAGSCMSGNVHVRFREKGGVLLLAATCYGVVVQGYAGICEKQHLTML